MYYSHSFLPSESCISYIIIIIASPSAFSQDHKAEMKLIKDQTSVSQMQYSLYFDSTHIIFTRN